jgi:chromate transporter
VLVSFSEQWRIWGRVALQSFGGPAGQIAVIHRIVVEEKKLISEERFLHALNFCMLLPGPEAQQLATYVGWLMGKWRGGLIAGGLFILPGFLSILFLSLLYVGYRDLAFVQGIFYGVKPAIIAVVLSSLVRISQKALTKNYHWILAGAAYVSLFFFNISFPIVVTMAALTGALHSFLVQSEKSQESHSETRPTIRAGMNSLLVWGLVWIMPILVTIYFFGTDSNFHRINLFFSKMSLVTFGGAYAALTYVAQRAVESYGWLLSGEMLDGLALAESTPGPLIQTVQFVGFLGGFRYPEFISPYASAILASLLTTWMTFAPCFLWIFTFAPYVEYIRGKRIISEVLAAITAAVVGVILNLSLWFILRTLFKSRILITGWGFDWEMPVLESVDYVALGIMGIALYLQFKKKAPLWVILLSAVFLGILAQFIFQSR